MCVSQVSSDGQPEQIVEKTIDLFLDGKSLKTSFLPKRFGQTNEKQRKFND